MRPPLPNGVYRTPGRAADAARIPKPSWRTLLAPLARTVPLVVLAAGAIALFNAVAPTAFGTSDAVRFIPAVDWIQDSVAVALPATLLVVVALVVCCVRPSWGGLRLPAKLLYVAALLAAHGAVVVAAEATIFFCRGGLHLFEPSHKTSAALPGGRTAHVYRPGGFRCGYEVYVSGPLSATATRVLEISRSTCAEPEPRVRANADGSISLVDAANEPLESQPSPGLPFLVVGGC